MFSASTIIQVYMAPRDAYSFTNFKLFHKLTKRRWRDCQIMGGEEIRALENNRHHAGGYDKRQKIRGWNHGTPLSENDKRSWKYENSYTDCVGDIYFDYYTLISDGLVDWWGVGGRINAKDKIKRHSKSVYIPNTPMFDPSLHLENNSIMEKIYLRGESFEKATAASRRGVARGMDIMDALVKANLNDGMSEEEAQTKAEKSFIIYLRNKAMADNPMLDNDYNFTMNYYNKFMDKKIREMMPIKLSFWFLKEILSNNPNLSFYVLGPYNILSRIHGLVTKRDQNVILKMIRAKQSKSKFEFVYSVSKDTWVNEADKGFIHAENLTPNKSKISNGIIGQRRLRVEKRFNSEIFYDMILDGKTFRGYSPWFDAHHNCWLTPDYSKPKNLRGLDIIC